jgi:polysaccharide biosynthesis protein PslG
MQRKYLWLLVALILILTSCGPGKSVNPTITPSLTSTLSYTYTPTSTPPVAGLPGATIPDGLGVQVLFYQTEQTELNTLSTAGFRIVRLDFIWTMVESIPGVYNFQTFDPFVESMTQRGIRVLFCLDGNNPPDNGNPLYDNGISPYTDDGRAAFARFAAAAVSHYKGKGIIWELWNEPDGGFWSPHPNVDDYAKLVEMAIPAMRQADPNVLIVGPSISNISDAQAMDFMAALGEKGILQQFDAIAVHPYRGTIPESVETDWLNLRRLVDAYSPNKKLPIISGEWGYTTGGSFYGLSGLSETERAQYLVRSWLVNSGSGINTSIWYVLDDYCNDPKNADCNFGIQQNDVTHTPKMAYVAAQTLIQTLMGYSFVRRISEQNQNDYLYLFRNGQSAVLAAWTIDESHTITLPLIGNNLQAVSMIGKKSDLSQSLGTISMELSGSPQYLLLGDTDQARSLISWQPLDDMTPISAGEPSTINMVVTNPTNASVSDTFTVSLAGKSIGTMNVDLGAQEQKTVSVPVIYSGGWDQPFLKAEISLVNDQHPDLQSSPIWLSIVNSLQLTVLPIAGQTVAIQINNPWREALQAKVDIKVGSIEGVVPVDFKQGESGATLTFKLSSAPPEGTSILIKLFDNSGNLVLEPAQVIWKAIGDISPLKGSWLARFEEGNGDVGPINSSIVDPPLGIPQPGLDHALMIKYSLINCNRNIIAPPPPGFIGITGKPKSINMWVYGNASEDSLDAAVIDNTGQTFWMGGPAIYWMGWQFVSISLTQSGTHWGGANDGIIHYPIHWYTPIIISCYAAPANGQRDPVYITGIAIQY